MTNVDSLLGLSQRLPPTDLAAEQALLGALLANNLAYGRVADFLAPEHFADPVHGAVFAAIRRRIDAGQVADVVTLRGELERSGELAEVGGGAYLAQLLSAMVGIVNAGEYGRLVHDCWLRRQLIDAGEEVVNDAFGSEPGVDAKGLLEKAEQRLFDLAKEGSGNEGGFIGFGAALKTAVDAAARAFETPGGVSGLSCGLRAIDAKTGGLHPSDLIILAGRPGMGKTALATKMAFGAAQTILREAAAKGEKLAGQVAIFSLEMSADQLATRLLSEEAKISGDRIRRGEIAQRDLDQFVRASRELATLPIMIDDTPALSVSALRTRCRRLHRTKGLKLVVVDYLQLMRPAIGTRPESRVLEISMITQGLKAIAKELAVPVLALSQLSRAVESREDKRPQLSDLRESGSIEQDADMVMFIYRDDYYLKQQEPKPAAFDKPEKFDEAHDRWKQRMADVHNLADLIIGKQRHGPTGTVPLYFEAEFTRFGDLETQRNP